MLFNAIKLNGRHLRGLRRYSSQSNAQHVRKSLSSGSIRNIFLDYFTEKQHHHFIRSSPVIPYCDPTVPFVNAGMNQFKNIFLGNAQAPSKTAANSQKCIRVGGKHNDLDVVGSDGYHHTFFEMLGNWSFGDYFKERACRMAWDLLTNEYGIHPSRLYVTYFSGNDKWGIGADIECKEIWRQIGVSEDRILPFGAKENFWEMGAMGPCGPCTEIHIDHLPNSSPATRARYVNADQPDLTELWNLVFIQYTRNADGSITQLKNRHIDTGMGFERLVSVLQEKSSNYDTDLFLPIFDAVAKAARSTPYGGTFDQSHSNYELDVAYRVLADHARMCTICIADGMFPERNFRLRRVFRKTINIGDKVFKAPHILEEAVIPQIVNSLGSTYPELERNYEQILKVVTHEASAYRSLLAESSKHFRKLNLRKDSLLTEIDALEYPALIKALKDVESQLKSSPTMEALSSENLFYLKTSYGLDEEILEKVAQEKGLTVQMDKFREYLNEQGVLSKQKLALDEIPYVEELKRKQLPKTDDRFKYYYEYDTDSKRYELPMLEAKVLHVGRGDASGMWYIVLDRTNFYATAGGQDADIGEIKANGQGGEAVFEVETVELYNDVVVHRGRFLDAARQFKVGESVTLDVNSGRRTPLTQHHTGTHLMQAAIQHVTKKIIYQKSSHVSVDYLKFDLGIIGDRLTSAEITEIEDLIRKIIKKPVEVKTDVLSAHELYACERITTVPGAVYPDNGIQVLRIEDPTNGFLSLEPCCGTHVKSTSELENFCITSIRTTKGTFEITAVCGQNAQRVLKKGEVLLSTMADLRAKVNKELTETELRRLLEMMTRMKHDLHKNDVPFTIKESAFEELHAMDKRVNVKLRESIRKWMTPEINDVISKSAKQDKPLVVHVFNSAAPIEFLLMRKANNLTNQYPTILINVSNGQLVSARASIPAKYTTDRFNAEIWLKETFAAVGIKMPVGKIGVAAQPGSSVYNLMKMPDGEIIDATELSDIAMQAELIFAKYVSS